MKNNGSSSSTSSSYRRPHKRRSDQVRVVNVEIHSPGIVDGTDSPDWHYQHEEHHHQQLQQQQHHSSLLQQALLSPTSCEPHSLQQLPRIDEDEPDTDRISSVRVPTHSHHRNADASYHAMIQNQAETQRRVVNNDTTAVTDTRSSFVQTSFTFRKFWTACLATTTGSTDTNTNTNTSTDHHHPPPSGNNTNHASLSTSSSSSSSSSSSRSSLQRCQLRTPDENRNQIRTRNHQHNTNARSDFIRDENYDTVDLQNYDHENHGDGGDDTHNHTENQHEYPLHRIDNDTADADDDADDDEVLNRCYFWSFLLLRQKKDHPRGSIDTSRSRDNGSVGGDDLVVALSNHQPHRPQQEGQPTNYVSLGSAIFMFLFIWLLGIHSMTQVQTTLSTDFTSLFAVSNQQENVADSSVGSTSHSSMLPIILVLSSSRNTQNRNSTSPLCAPISRRGSPTYQQGHDFSTGIEQYLVENTNASAGTLPTLHVASFYSYMADGLEWWAREDMATPDGTSVFVTIDIESNRHDNRPPQTKRVDSQRRQLLINAIDEYTAQFYSHYDTLQNSTAPLCLTVHPTGMPYLEVQLSASILSLTRTILGLVAPIVILFVSIMMWYLYNVILSWIWIIPFVVVIVSVSILCIILQYIMIPYLPSSVSVFTPLILVTMSMATSCVQIISLMSRYLEEMGATTIMMNPADPNECSPSSSRAVRRMWKSSGSTMISTGWIGMAVVLTFWIGCTSVLAQNIFIGMVVATVTTSFVNITIISTILLYTPLGVVIIGKKNESTGSGQIVNQANHVNDDDDRVQNDGAEISQDRELNRHRSYESDYVLLEESFAAQMLPTPRQSIWFCLARNIVHPYRAIILILLLLQILLPVVFHLKHIQLSYQPMNVLSTNSKSMESYRTLGHLLGHGRLHPYRIVFDGHSSNVSMTSKVGFAVMHSVINEIQSRTFQPLSHRNMWATIGENPADLAAWYPTILLPNHNWDVTQLKYDMFNGIAVVQNTVVSYDMFLAATYCVTPTRKKNYCPFELLRMIAASNKHMTSNDTFTTYARVELGVDPFSSAGIDWLRHARSKLDRFRQEGTLHGVTVDISGTGELVYDTAAALSESIHLLMYVSIATTVIFLSTFFRSLVLPIRSIVTVWLAASFSLGLGVAVYQDGILDWAKIKSLQSITGDEGICWFVPILAFPVVFGLSLLLDVQLQSRILEFRERGFDSKSSIALGLDAIGGCNTCTGLILAIIFGTPLVVGENRMLHQWSFIVITSVVVDIVVTHTMVPVIFSSVSFNWWPRRLPAEKLFLEEFNSRNPLQIDDSIGDNPSTYWETLIASSEYEPLSHNR